MNFKSFFIIIGVSLLASSCNKDKENAQQLLTNAKEALSIGKFAEAKAELDSLNAKYPRAFEERKASITLLDSIRLIENDYYRNILNNKKDSIQKEIDVAKIGFQYSKNDKYQDIGTFISKSFPIANALMSTTLEAGVYESGKMYLKSIYVGSQKHNKIKASSDDESAETLTIELDGYTHRFRSLGKNYEVIYVQENYNNGIFSFLEKNADNKIKLELIGNNNYKYELNRMNKKAIAETYKLSVLILYKDSIETELQKIAYKDFYLNHQRNSSIPINENQDTSETNDQK